MSDLVTDLIAIKMLREFLSQVTYLIRTVNWGVVIRAFFILIVGVIIAVWLLSWCDNYMSRLAKNRIKRHKLSIVNAGNLPSVYLFRSVSLPDNIAIRFRSNGQPMIWITRLDKDDLAAREKEEKKESGEDVLPEPAAEAAANQSASAKLIPDLNNPMKNLKAAEMNVKTKARKASRVSTFLSNVTSLFNVKNSVINKAASTLKDAAQITTQTLTGMDSNLAKASSLMNQAGGFIPDKAADQVKQGAADALQKDSEAPSEADEPALTEFSMAKNFTYDEAVWRKNMTRRDKFGGSMIYAQSELINPGETLDVEVEILNMDESGAPVTLGYGIEITQIPRSKAAFTAPRQTVDGVVTFPKLPLWKMILPTALTVLMVAGSIQIIAALCLALF